MNSQAAPSVYDPQKNTFIKVPEAKTCPACGQLIQPEVKPMDTHMNNYISEQGNVVTIASGKDVIEVGESKVKMYRCDSRDKETGRPTSTLLAAAVAAKKAPTTPVTPGPK